MCGYLLVFYIFSPNNQLILPWHSNDPPSSKPVSILLTAPSADPSEFPKPCLENEHINISNQALSVLSDPSQMKTIHNPSNSELSVVPRRASDDSKVSNNSVKIENIYRKSSIRSQPLIQVFPIKG